MAVIAFDVIILLCTLYTPVYYSVIIYIKYRKLTKKQTAAMEKGLGLHLKSLPITVNEALYFLLLGDFIANHFYTLGASSAQLSLLALYWRMFESIRNVRIAIYVITCCIIIWAALRVRILAWLYEYNNEY